MHFDIAVARVLLQLELLAFFPVEDIVEVEDTLDVSTAV
jgi:hypothetical protein